MKLTKSFQTALLGLAIAGTALAADTLPTPSANQIRWQDMEMYAFIHYSLNTYTDQEWGYGNEDPALFNPSELDCRQWVQTCKNAGMKGIIITAKHHCGFCLWPSEYTEYSVKNSPWKEGKGDMLRELSEACREEGLKLGVYLSPWDRNSAVYGTDDYITYFRNQLTELMTQYGDIFEIWFDGANGGDGWYGGADETRKINAKTYYQWPGTFKLVRDLQPEIVVWNDGGDRGDLRWVGTEQGYVGARNWSQLNPTGDVPFDMLHHGLEDGTAWVAAEVDTSIRPGWFYHADQDDKVKTLSKLVEMYHKSVGRNSSLLLNFPVAPNGKIHRNDSLRGVEFKKYLDDAFSNDLAAKAKVKKEGAQTELSWKKPQLFNRFLVQEDIAQGQRVKSFKVEALTDAGWMELKDEYEPGPDGTSTIGYRRILCFPEVKATKLRFTVTDSKAEPRISRLSVFNAPNIQE